MWLSIMNCLFSSSVLDSVISFGCTQIVSKITSTQSTYHIEVLLDWLMLLEALLVSVLAIATAIAITDL